MYTDFWTIKVRMFEDSKDRIRFRREHNGLLIFITGPLSHESIDTFLGYTFPPDKCTRRDIIMTLIMQEPDKARFSISDTSEADRQVIHEWLQVDTCKYELVKSDDVNYWVLKKKNA